MTRKTIVISINSSWNIINFRKGLIRALQEDGYRVVAIASPDGYEALLRDLGVEYHPIEIDSQGLSVGRDIMLLARYYRLFRRIRPDVYLGYTAKPNVYGSIAARMLGIHVINNVAGLGTAFIRRGMLAKVVTALYKLAFRQSQTVFFQNDDDLNEFLQSRVVRRGQAKLLPGSGIDLSEFQFKKSPVLPGHRFTYLLIARLLWDKGVGEYVEAARILREQLPDARFQLLGFLDVSNRTAVSNADVQRWVAEGIVEYCGKSDDVRPFIAAADCIVLPSYREGLPRALLEGAAMGKPLIATDVPGCRHVVEHGENGFLCEVRNAASLADAMLKMAQLSSSQREAMGEAARAKVAAEFDEKLAVDLYRRAILGALERPD